MAVDPMMLAAAMKNQGPPGAPPPPGPPAPPPPPGNVPPPGGGAGIPPPTMGAPMPPLMPPQQAQMVLQQMGITPTMIPTVLAAIASVSQMMAGGDAPPGPPGPPGPPPGV